MYQKVRLYSKIPASLLGQNSRFNNVVYLLFMVYLTTAQAPAQWKPLRRRFDSRRGQ